MTGSALLVGGGPAGAGPAPVAGGRRGVELPAARASRSSGCSARCRCSRAPFTLEAAEAVAGPGAGPAVLRLVDCSLLVPPRAGPDGRSRYVMLETLRAYGAGAAGRGRGAADAAAAALARHALQVAEQAAAGLQTATGEPAAARWLDAEDATMRQALALGAGARRGHRAAAGDRAGAMVAAARRLGAGYPLLRAAAGHAEAGQ